MGADREVLRNELRVARRAGGFGLTFGGEVTDGLLWLRELEGAYTNGLRNLPVRQGTGLGGRVLAQGEPAGVADYGSARGITHDYDRPVLAEGITSVLAVPVQVHGSCRAVLYGAERARMPLGDRGRDALARAARRIGEEVRVREEVQRRVDAAEQLRGDPADRDAVRAVHSELRAIAGVLADPQLRERVEQAAGRLGMLGTKQEQPAVQLSKRETDVLAQVALGRTNAEAAQRLSISKETVKAYLYSVMRKLDVRTRYEAVLRGRAAGLLP